VGEMQMLFVAKPSWVAAAECCSYSPFCTRIFPLIITGPTHVDGVVVVAITLWTGSKRLNHVGGEALSSVLQADAGQLVTVQN